MGYKGYITNACNYLTLHDGTRTPAIMKNPYPDNVTWAVAIPTVGLVVVLIVQYHCSDRSFADSVSGSQHVAANMHSPSCLHGRAEKHG